MAAFTVVASGEMDVVDTQAVRLCAAEALAPTLSAGAAYGAAVFSHKHGVLVYARADAGGGQVELACVGYGALEAAKCDTADVDDAEAVVPASRSPALAGPAVALALAPSEEQVAVVCEGSGQIALFALPDLQPCGQCDAGAPPAACAWTDDTHLLVQPAAPACARLLGVGGGAAASSAMGDVAAVCVGWLSDAQDAAPKLFVANADTVQQCGVDLQPQKEIADVAAPGFRISQLNLLGAKTLFVGYMPLEGQEEEPFCRFVDLTERADSDPVEDGWIGESLFEEEDGERLIPHRVSYFLAPFRGDDGSTSALMVTSCAGTVALMQSADDGQWEAWDPEETIGNDVPMPVRETYEYDRVIGAAVRIAPGGRAGTGLFYTGEGRLMMFPMHPEKASMLMPPVVRSGGGGDTAATGLGVAPIAPAGSAPSFGSFGAAAAAPAVGPAPATSSFSFSKPASSGDAKPPAFGGFGAAAASSSSAAAAGSAPATSSFSFSKPGSAPATSSFSFSKPASSGVSGSSGDAKPPAFGGFGAAAASSSTAASAGSAPATSSFS
eukprot:COSAG02_NODE_8754_length_2454_cov_10.070488_1_plen_552_part_10